MYSSHTESMLNDIFDLHISSNKITCIMYCILCIYECTEYCLLFTVKIFHCFTFLRNQWWDGFLTTLSNCSCASCIAVV